MKKGLVLEGGAMRGMFTSGVTDVFMENGIVFDGAVGVSAGATFGCNIKSGQPGRAIRYNKRFARNWRYCSMRSFLFFIGKLLKKVTLLQESPVVSFLFEVVVVHLDAEDYCAADGRHPVGYGHRPVVDDYTVDAEQH